MRGGARAKGRRDRRDKTASRRWGKRRTKKKRFENEARQKTTKEKYEEKL